MATLGEIRADDLDNGEYLLQKHMKRHYFMTLEEYTGFQTEFLKNMLEKAGISRTELCDNDHAVKKMIQNGVRIECRKRTGEDAWRSGYYVYKDNEIAAFLSAPHSTMSVFSAWECVL